MKIINYVSLLLLMWSGASLANGNQNFCLGYELDNKYQATLPRLAQQSKGIVNKFCSAELTDERAITSEIYSLIVEANRDLKRLGIKEGFFPFDSAVEQVKEDVDSDRSIENMGRWPNPNEVGIRYYGDRKVKNENECNEQLEKSSGNALNSKKTCSDVIEAFQEIYNYSQLIIQKKHTDAVQKYLNLSSQQWDDYFTKSRSQTSLEMLINGYEWRKDKQPGMFLEPPAMQWIVLHPSIVIENVSDAVDGDNTEEGIMIELLGVNWWQQDKWYQPTGASIVSVYSDRAETKDWGHGLAVHFDNKYTIGAVDHDGSTGVFISIDLLELFKDKRSFVDEYIGKFK